jgi:hypothetical protein
VEGPRRRLVDRRLQAGPLEPLVAGAPFEFGEHRLAVACPLLVRIDAHPPDLDRRGPDSPRPHGTRLSRRPPS